MDLMIISKKKDHMLYICKKYMMQKKKTEKTIEIWVQENLLENGCM